MSGAGAIAVRRATVDDVERMVELYAEVADEGRWIGSEGPIDRADVRRRWVARLAAPDSVHLVAEVGAGVGADVGAVVVGQASIDLTSYGVAYLGMLVGAQWRRRGVGTALVGAALGAAADRGCHKVSLQVWPHNDAARALYGKLGFEDEGVLRAHYPRRNGELWDAVVMGLLLPPRSPPPLPPREEVEDDGGHDREHD